MDGRFLKICFVIIWCGFLFSCSPKEKAKPVVQTLTFIGLGMVDSVTETNDRFGVKRFVHFDFNKDSISIYRKEFNFTYSNMPGKPALPNFDRFRKDTVIRHLKADTILANFVDRAKSFDFQKFYQDKFKQHRGQGILCDNAYYFLVRIETDSAVNIFNYSSSIPVTEFEKVTKLLVDLTKPENLSPTNTLLNEDSVLKPILLHPEFSKIFTIPPPPPPPDAPPPPPPLPRK